jgi:flagellar motor component MotA
MDTHTPPQDPAEVSPKVKAPVLTGALVTAVLAVLAALGVEVDADPEEVAAAVALILTTLYGIVGYLKQDPLRRR